MDQVRQAVVAVVQDFLRQLAQRRAVVVHRDKGMQVVMDRIVQEYMLLPEAEVVLVLAGVQVPLELVAMVVQD